MKMGQYWKLVNIDKRKALAHDSGLKLLEMLGDRALEPLVGLLRRPQWVPYLAPSYAIQSCKLQSVESPLITLPQELIEQIVSFLVENEGDGSGDLICLSLSCSYFFRLLGSRVQTLLAEDEAPWAGDRLIFVGDYANGIPEGIVTETERTQLLADGRNPLYYSIEQEFAEKDAIFEQSWYDSDEIEYSGSLFSRLQKRIGSTPECKKAIKLINDVLQHIPTDANGHPPKKAVLLRNLTAKEFVLDDSIASSSMKYSLGEVLGTFTVWTEDGSGTQSLETPGRWAGHRFDIGCFEDVEEGWKDVSDEAVQNLEAAGLYGYGVGRRAWE
ncbi:unnamed protein product [Clonostachys rhizophaga]|uniref:Uncharacterized protein n=1 Tax=Clonostachys rhizophaga TaxID=160324 RepID=A0A9N9VBS7_9HYPO|nr:unnamed protein product [Clonostachys rhizophaga]